jgi:oligopeptide/dipeptide ABC transporter ATP-binding protein
MAMLFISHDIMVVKYLCDRVAVMYLGVIVETAPAAELFHNPLHPYTQALIASAPKLEMDKIKSRELLEGDPAGAFDSLQGCRFAPRCKHCRDRCRGEKPPLVKTAEDHWAACFDVPADAEAYADKTG